ncbi:alpha/beta hydrolase family protein [Streptomyces sp. NPDC058157]|uniref:alpha/beta hydrolase family protein n=1 Tax=Streptomyces sp. NPDC058157 TaxID=3346360 RepID=UPI0036E7A814
MTKLIGEEPEFLTAPAPVAAFVTAADASVSAVLTAGRAPAVLLHRAGTLRTLREASPTQRPVEVGLCPAGCHLLTVVRTVEGREAHVFDTATGELARILPGIGRIAVLMEGCRLVAVDDAWPLPDVLETPCTGGPVLTRPVRSSVLGLFEDASGPIAHCTRPGHPPDLVPLAQLVDAGEDADADPPPRHHTVNTRWGALRVLTVPAVTEPVGDVVMLHGGPYGVWIPRWDPQVELLARQGYQVHQLEAPYTASLRRAHTRFVPGDFGVKDVESVTDAVAGLAAGTGRPVLLFGFSYGGLLAARTAAALPHDVDGVFLMSAVWRSADVQQLIDDDRPAPGDLRAFLTHAFPDRRVDLPEVELPPAVNVAVVHGTRDTVAPFALVEAACAATPGVAFTPLTDEDHIPRRGSSVVRALYALHTWLQHCEGTP